MKRVYNYVLLLLFALLVITNVLSSQNITIASDEDEPPIGFSVINYEKI